MSDVLAPPHEARAPRAMAASVDVLATQAALGALQEGGTAVDAAIAANAVLGVTLPNQCGMGGDLFALVSAPGTAPRVVTAVGRAGSGMLASELRDAGLRVMPAEGDVRSVTIPGCVDGWVALHAEHGRLSLGRLLEPAIGYARDGFPASRFFAETVVRRGRRSPEVAALAPGGTLATGGTVRRPGLARVLEEVAAGGREAFYEGEFGRSLLALTGPLVTAEDLRRRQAEWTEPIAVDVLGARLWGPAPPSQAYIALAAAWMADRLDVPRDPEDPGWAHLLVEALRQASYDRPEVLSEAADGRALLEEGRLRQRLAAIDPARAARMPESYRTAGTTYLCVVDAEGMAVSLMQSNCMSFGSGLTVGETGVWLHNRGIGFSLEPGHPAELAPGRRPPHTLAPALVTDTGDRAIATIGTRGGDTQPQVVLQLLARILGTGQSPAEALAAGRWAVRGASDDTSFRTWEDRTGVRILLEGNAPARWDELARYGHEVERTPAFDHQFGHAQVILRTADGLVGAADPRSDSGSAAGY